MYGIPLFARQAGLTGPARGIHRRKAAARAVGSFWEWYEHHYSLNLSVAAALFLLQLVHLAWLTGEVVWARAFGAPAFSIDGAFAWLLYVVDYTEIPALVSVSLLYVNELRKKRGGKSLAYLLFLNTQWLHIFWITDEFVVSGLEGTAPQSSLPAWLAWGAILIDYLELPVIMDTVQRLIGAIGSARLAAHPVVIAVEPMRIGADDREGSVDIGAVEIRRRGRDAHVRVGRIAGRRGDVVGDGLTGLRRVVGGSAASLDGPQRVERRAGAGSP
jgi:hypothetical protein